MGFYLTYRKSEKSDKENKLPGKTSTILPFLGFKYDVDYSTSYSKRGGETTLTYKGNGKYEVGKNPTYVDETNYTEAIFSRKAFPTGKVKALEDQIYEAIRYKYTNDGEFDVFKTPYFSPSVRDYYYDEKII